jgi:hypothetical protein
MLHKMTIFFPPGHPAAEENAQKTNMPDLVRTKKICYYML